MCREDGAELFLVVLCDRTRANGQMLKYRIFYLSLKPPSFSCEDDHEMEEIALRDCEVSILGDIHNLTSYSPELHTPQDTGFACKG